MSRDPARLYAVSERWGGTLIYDSLTAVEAGARAMMGYVQWIEAKQQELREAQ